MRMHWSASWKPRSALPILASVLVLLFLAGLYWAWRPVGMEDADTSLYLSGAKSFVDGHGYRFAAHANTPRITIVPPLQSLYLAAWWKLHPSFPDNMDTLYVGMIFLAMMSLLLVSRYWREEGIPAWPVLAIVLVWGVALSWVFVIYWFLSDVLFGLFWVLLALHWRSREALATTRWWAGASLLLVLMFLTRTAALAPIAATGVAALFGARPSRWKNTFVYALPLAATVLCWWRWTAANHNYGSLVGFFQSYEGGWVGLAKLCLSNLTGYLSGNTFMLGLAPTLAEQMTAPGRFDSAGGIALFLLLQGIGLFWMFLWAYGVFKLGSRREKWLAFVVIAYLVEVGLWPYDFSTRGGFAVLPILVPWAWRGGAALARRWRAAPVIRMALPIVAAALFVSNLRLLQSKVDSWNRLCRFDELREVAEWVRKNTPTNAVIASTWTLPNLYFSEFSERQIVTDYFRRTPTWEPVSHAAQNFVPAHYVLTSYKWDLDVNKEDADKFTLVKMSSQRWYRLHRVPDTLVMTSAK